MKKNPFINLNNNEIACGTLANVVPFVCLAILMGAFYTGWVVFAATIMPQGWLGGMDGYFYASMVKTYLNQFSFAAIDPASPMNYPQYFFYFLGKLGQIFNLGHVDLSHLMWRGQAYAILGFIFLSFVTLRNGFSAYGAIGVILIFFLLYLNPFSVNANSLMWGFTHLWEKSHEIISLISFPACFAYVSYLAGRDVSVGARLFAGACLGFAFGAYTPFAIVPMSAMGTIILFEILKNRQNLSLKTLLKIFDIPFFGAAALIVFPYILTIAITLLTHDQGMGHVPAAFKHNLEFEFLKDKHGNQSYIFSMAIAAISVILGIYATLKNKALVLDYQKIYAVLLVIIGLALFTYFVNAYSWGVKHTSPFKYILHLPFAAALLCVLYAESLAAKNWLSKYKAISSLVLCGLVLYFSWTLPPTYMKKILKSHHYNFSYTFFKNRSNSLAELVNHINQKKNEGVKLERYLGNYEHNFINVMVKGRFVSHIMFNESYASVYENVQERAKNLAAAANNPDDLYQELKNSNIDVLLFAYNLEKNGYLVKHSITVGEEIQKPNEFFIPKTTLDRLVKNQKLSFEKVKHTHVYYIN